jgi:hypothetical protein
VGGLTDTLARLVAAGLADKLPLVLVTSPGTGIRSVTSAAPWCRYRENPAALWHQQ